MNVKAQVDSETFVWFQAQGEKDPRCRIWDWYIKDNNDGHEGIRIENACFLTSFSVDDFLQEIE